MSQNILCWYQSLIRSRPFRYYIVLILHISELGNEVFINYYNLVRLSGWLRGRVAVSILRKIQYCALCYEDPKNDADGVAPQIWGSGGRSEAPSGVRVVAPRAHAFSCNLEARSAVREHLELWLMLVEKSYWKAWRRVLGCLYHVVNRN